MPKPTTVKLVGTFEMPDTVSLKDLHEALATAQAHLVEGIGPGTLVLKIGRQELRA